MGIAEILMKRDGYTREEAQDQVSEARDEMYSMLSRGENPEDICEMWFGLEPDYIDELL